MRYAGDLVHAGGASSLTDAAYRVVRHEPRVDADLRALAARFGHMVGVGLDRPDMSP